MRRGGGGMAFCRIPPVTGSDFVWVDYGGFALSSGDFLKESRRQTSFPQIYDACRLKVLNSRSALKHTDFLYAACAVNLGHIRNGGKEKAVGTFSIPLRRYATPPQGGGEGEPWGGWCGQRGSVCWR